MFVGFCKSNGRKIRLNPLDFFGVSILCMAFGLSFKVSIWVINTSESKWLVREQIENWKLFQALEVAWIIDVIDVERLTKNRVYSGFNVVWSQNSVACDFHERDEIYIVYALLVSVISRKSSERLLCSQKVKHSVDKVSFFNYNNHCFWKDSGAES